MFALIFEGKVVDVAEEPFDVVDTMEWIECPSNTSIGHYYFNGEFKSSLKTSDQLLVEAKTIKISEIKIIRDSKNIEPVEDIQASILDAEGNPTSDSSYFIFHTSRHPTNPAADPGVILTGAIILNQTIPYSTKSPSGEKITVALTPGIAQALSAHIALRNNNNYKLADAIIKAINDATTEEAVNAITWNVDYL